jgi:hypothetical protein
MTRNHSTSVIQDLADDILLISLSGRGMEKSYIFVSKLHNSLGKPLLPIFSLNKEEVPQMRFNHLSETGLMTEKAS